MAIDKTKPLDLGFVEKANPEKLLSHLFPSKVGGKPSWLSLNPLPTNEVLSCRQCSKPCVFLLQIYAPLEIDPSTFHRMFFLFVCPDPNCCKTNENRNLVVVRSQIPRHNDFYSDKPPKNAYADAVIPTAVQYGSLCVVCGCAGGKKCSVCHQATYCSKHHQTLHWKAGHKKQCKAGVPEQHADKCNVLFAEFEILIEEEEAPDETSDTESVEDYEVDATTSAADIKDLEKMALSDEQSDQAFAKFKERISHEPDQVLRYERGGSPLLVSDEGVPVVEDIPACDCGAPRQFEFQVVSHLLSHLGVDSLSSSLDWGTLLVYTCSRSCHIGNTYRAEYVCPKKKLPPVTEKVINIFELTADSAV